MSRYTRLYWQFFKARLKVMMEYRADFLIGVISVFFIQGTSILFIKIIFNYINDLNGWTFYQLLFIYAVAMLGRSLEHVFFDNLWTFGWQYIQTGNFDRLLIRPVNVLFQVVADRVQQDGVGSFIIGLIVLFTSASHLGLHWTFWQIVLLCVMILSSSAIFMAINLFFAAFSFWMVDSLPVMSAIFGLSEFARYPLTIYNKGIRFILTFIIPYGFTAFYPAALFIQNSGFHMFALFSPLVALICLSAAYLFWNRGLKSYTGTGS